MGIDLEYYATAGPMTELVEGPAFDGLPTDVDDLRKVVQGLLVHRDWVTAYGIEPESARYDEQHLRSCAAVIERAIEIDPRPLCEPRDPEQRVVGICRHFALLFAALLRREGIPARARCGFARYFEPRKWVDHWITERWDGTRWVRDDPQHDDLQRSLLSVSFDSWDQPAGEFLTGGEAWLRTRAGESDPMRYGIFDMWGPAYISGNLINDFACLNKVELLPWDSWGMMGGPHRELTDEECEVFDDLATVAGSDNTATIRERYQRDEAVRVPPVISTFRDGAEHKVELAL